MKPLYLRLTALLLLCCVASPAFSEIEEYFDLDGIYYGIISGTEVGVTGCDSEMYDLVIPESVSYNGKEYRVTQITDYAFWSAQFRTVEIPATVTSIGESAFLECMYLKDISLPNSVKDLGQAAFKNCKSLERFESGSSLTDIEGDTFQGCASLTSVTLGNSITTIGWYAFAGCSALQSITISDSVETLEPYAFEGCTSLHTIYIGRSMTYIDNTSLQGCPVENLSINCIDIKDWFQGWDIKNLEIGDSCEKISQAAFFQCLSLENVIIGNSVASIEQSAFEMCSKLTDVKFGDSIKVIERQAFSGCFEISELNLPQTLEYIGENAFSILYNITQLVIPASVSQIGSYAFSNCTNLKKVWLDGSNLTIVGGNGIFSSSAVETITIEGTRIPNTLCYGCENLVEVNISDDVTYIGDYAFAYCSELESIPLPDTVSFIGEGAFLKCSTLSSIKIPDNVSEISRIAFKDCSALTDVTLGKNLEFVDSDAFAFCKSIKNVYSYSNSVPRLGDRCFDELPSGAATLYVREELLSDYQISHWTVYFSKILPLEDAGMESLLANPDSRVSVYSTEGVLIRKDCKIEDLKTLTKGIYIIISGKDSHKISL